MYAQLLTALFKFLSPFLRNAELAKPVHRLYRGTLRVLLVLLHDFPEFLCDYHYGFCDVIPPNCIQMRNLILSDFPRNMRLPDPFTPNLKVKSYFPSVLLLTTLPFAGGHVTRDLHRPPHGHKLCCPYQAKFQEGSGQLPEEQSTGLLPL